MDTHKLVDEIAQAEKQLMNGEPGAKERLAGLAHSLASSLETPSEIIS